MPTTQLGRWLAVNAQTAVVAVATSILLLPTAQASSSEETIRRARVPNSVALGIAAELFPEQCGPGGQRCGITYGAEYCPLQFAITFPRAAGSPKAQPPGAWVTVDALGKVVEVSSTPSKECRNGKGIAS